MANIIGISMTITQTKLAELYVSFFNRAPDSAGLAYWVDQLDKGSLSLEDISRNWMSEQPEGLAKYPSTLTNADFISKIYQATLGRAPDAEGLAYWQNQLTNNSVGRDVFLAAVINGAKENSSTQGVLDAATLSNKATAGLAFADKGLNDLTLAGQVVASVNNTPDSLTAAKAVIQLVPATAADLSPALINLLSKAFDSIINLSANAPGEMGDLATYLTAVAGKVSAATNLTTLFTSINTKVMAAQTNPAALDNPVTQAIDDVATATPGGSTGGATFTVSDVDGVVTFAGTATGDITFSVSANGEATFVRGGVTAATKVSIATIDSLAGAATIKLSANAELSNANAMKLTALAGYSANGKSITLVDTATNLLNSTFSGEVANKLSADAEIDAVTASQLAALTGFGLNGKSVTLVDTATNLLNSTFSGEVANKLSADAELSNLNAMALVGLTGYNANGKSITLVDTATNLLNSTFSGEVANKLSADTEVDTLTASHLAALTGFNLNGKSVTLVDTATNLLNSTFSGEVANKLSADAIGLGVGDAQGLIALNGFNLNGHTYSISDTILAANGQNFTTGFTGNTGVTLAGSIGNQTVTGSAYADTIAGGAGADTLTGGGGNDTFVFAPSDSTLYSMDTITDYRASGSDTISWTGVPIFAGDTTFAGTFGSSGVMDADTLGVPTGQGLNGVNMALDLIASFGGNHNATYVFQYDGNTYIYVNAHAGMYDPNDTVIKLTGLVGIAGVTDIHSLGITGLA